MTKKKAIRVGHRGAARRLISKIEEELEKETTQRDEIESLCETLKKKRDILSELDNKILEEIAEENMEAEIEDSDRAVVCDLEKFWNLESLGVSGSDNIKSQSEVVKEYGEKSIILENGKYTAKLPWKPDFLPLPHNMELVKQRTGSVIRRLANKPDLLKMYGDIIMEQERRHFIEKVEETKLPTDRPVHYIPHHPVAKESSTTPIRIVYDCSCKDGRDNPSLNECLESHPPVMNDITGILMRFRAKKYATTSDLEKAFLQIQLDEKDRDATRFLWLSDPYKHIKSANNISLQVRTFRSYMFAIHFERHTSQAL
ncbi:Hypothetical predicted protein [Mytilus galloprovincialis]|uniref:Reverse transcriptase domain-containing protein n=1 Tax=Mytilus galloprovincialis TaxID=29158 RepID=A0A8B6E0B0_MYTGA|nr:Hypothetical predicted protein [Mytilus galloprovincialis]